MSPLRTALSDLRPSARGPRCSLGALLDDLATTDPEGCAALRAALDDPTASAPAVAAALISAGYSIRGETVRRHRKRGTATGCACE